MANGDIGVKGWRNYSSFSLFASGSQRADRNTSILVDTYSGNLSVLATDWNVAARIPCVLARAYNHKDTTSVDRPFGPGWYWQFDMNLTGSMNGTGNVTWKAADGSEYEFTYSAGPVWAAPAGMHEYTLTFNSSPTPDQYTISVGTMKYIFEVNTTDSIARLIRIEDAFGNALNIVRVYASSKPTAEIDKIQIEYDNSGPATHDIVDFTYSGALITKLRLLDTVATGNYLDLHYTYTTIDSADRLTKMEPKFGSTALDMEVKYDYNSTSTLGLQMTKLYDTNGAKGSYYWQATYGSNKVATIVFPIDSTPTTGTVTYTYATSAPSSWSHASPSAWNKVTDAESKDWYYGQDSDARVVFAVDPLWVNSTHESYTEYAYNADMQVTSAKTPRPNAESGQLTTSYYYNSDKHLAAVVDAYGFVSWYAYGTRATYATSGTAATVKEVIGVFTPMPNQKAYDDADHTASETVAPTLSSPVTVSSFVGYNTYVANEWAYEDFNSDPIKLVRAVNDYTFTTGTGKLTQLLSASPVNFAEASATSYTLTSASAASKQVYDGTTSDLSETYTPRQFKDGALLNSTFVKDQVSGATTHAANADGMVTPMAPDYTVYNLNSVKTLPIKVELPQDNTNQWTEYAYDNRLFRLSTKRPDIASWGVDPIISVSVYDYNGNVVEVWQAKPGATPADWDGTTGGGGYDQIGAYTYDRLNRLIQSDTMVDLDQLGTPATLVSTFKYDKNGNRTRARGPGYDVSATTYYSYTFVEYDGANRPNKAYNMIASTNASLGSVTGGTPFVENLYDLAGNTTTVRDQLYSGGAPSYHHTDFTYDWKMRQIATTANYNDGGATARTTQQHFDAAGLQYWSMDGEGYQLFPEYDNNGRQVKLHRGSLGGDADLRVYDYNGNLQYYYTYDDVNTLSSLFRWRYKYDKLDRRVNEGREQYTGGSWQNWNSNTADSTFDLNGNLLTSYDKVNTSKYTERTYDDWQQVVLVKSPEVPDPSGGGNIIYETESFYDVLGRRSSVDDNMDNNTAFVYDELGRVTRVTDALSYDVITFYDERGNRKEVDSPNGAVTSYTYNARNLLSLTSVDHDGTTDDTAFDYDDIGNLTQTVYPDGGEVNITYDELSRRILSSVLLSGSDYLDTAFEHDLNNRVVLTTLPGAYTVAYDYDDLGNLLTLTDTNGDDTDYSYDPDNRRETETRPNGLVTTWSYDWKTRQVSSVLYERNTTGGDDITVSYTYDDNGQAVAITDGRSYIWGKAYDAMLRMTLISMPSGGAPPTYATVYDGNSNIIKTVDFKSVTHYYFYDELNRMIEHGPNATITTNTEKYTWTCCARMTAYVDAQGTASLGYDDLGRLETHTDSNGNTVAYEYDEMSRVSKITPAQGTNYRTQYLYNANGSLAQVKAYDGGVAADTDYTYDTTSGKLTARAFPTVAAAFIQTAYSYDSAGRLEYETVTKEAGGTTNLYKTQYAYSYIAAGSGGGRQVIRTEQVESSGWVNDSKTTYKWDSLERQNYEQRHDWVASAWAAKYDISQVYDKNGNRTGYDKNVQGLTASYGRQYNLTYTYDLQNKLTAISDADDANWSATVSCDGNNNITTIDEIQAGTAANHLYTYFDYDALNRLTAHRTKAYVPLNWVWKKRAHLYDALGRVAYSTYKTWNDGSGEPGGDSLEHVYSKDGKHIQNYDGSSYGEVWHWAGSGDAQNSHNSPVRSPNSDTASTRGYNVADDKTPQRRTFVNPTPTEGDQRHLWGQGRPMAKDSSGGGAGWFQGTPSIKQNPITQSNVESRLFYEGTVTATDMSRATDAREKERIGIFGTGQSYAGSYGRVTMESIGRDLNPLGRGDGIAFLAGGQPSTYNAGNLGRVAPSLPEAIFVGGWGNTVNNGCLGCGSYKQPPPGSYSGSGEKHYVPTEHERDCLTTWAANEADAPGCGASVCIWDPCCQELNTSDCNTAWGWERNPIHCQEIHCACVLRGCRTCISKLKGSRPKCFPNCPCEGEMKTWLPDDSSHTPGGENEPDPCDDCDACMAGCGPKDASGKVPWQLLLKLAFCGGLCFPFWTFGSPAAYFSCVSRCMQLAGYSGNFNLIKQLTGQLCCLFKCTDVCNDIDDITECSPDCQVLCTRFLGQSEAVRKLCGIDKPW